MRPTLTGVSYAQGRSIKERSGFCFTSANERPETFANIFSRNKLQPSGAVVTTIDHVGLWQQPWIVGNLPLVGPLLNVSYNFWCQKLTYKSVGMFLADNLGPGEEMRGKRVGILEDTGKAGA